MIAFGTLKFVFVALAFSILPTPATSASSLFEGEDKGQELRFSRKEPGQMILPKEPPLPTRRPVSLFESWEGLTSTPVSLKGIFQPLPGHVKYCKRYQWDCEVKTSWNTPAIELTWERLALIDKVNREVNSEVLPVSDEYLYKTDDYWEYPHPQVMRGDCEDIVLEKRWRLMAHGFPHHALLITKVMSFEINGNKTGHAVLTVRTRQGDIVLDNLETSILPWQESKHRFDGRQSPYDSSAWERLIDNRPRSAHSQAVAQNKESYPYF